MDPVTNKLLQGTPYVGMGGTQERNALIGVIRNLISEDKYTVDYILNYAQSVGYQRQMAEEVFKELTGLSPKLIVNNNEYYNGPSYLPPYSIAWGYSKTKPNTVNLIVPFEYGYAVMEKDEVNAPIPTVISATIPEAFDELKKVAKGIQTLDKIITKKLLEAEDVQTDAHTVHQVNLPYAASPLQVLKKNFKDKVLSVSEFERQASQMLEAGELTVDEAEDLMTWKQDLIDEDESYANEVLQLNENWKPLDAEDVDENAPDYEERVQEAYKQLAGMIEEVDILADFAKRSGIDRLFDAYIQLGKDIANEWDVKPEAVFGEITLSAPELTKKLEDIDKENFNKEVETWKKQSTKVDDSNFRYTYITKEEWDNTPDDYKMLIDGIRYMMFPADHPENGGKLCPVKIKNASKKQSSQSIDELKQIIKNMKEEGKSRTFAINYLDGKGIDYKIINEILNEAGYNNENKVLLKGIQSSKKVTAENMTLDDIEAEDNKDQVQEEIEKIEETPAEDIFTESTPEQYFDKALQEDKVDTINDVVSKCIDKFSEKFKDFDKYQVKILSYNTKVLEDDKPVQEEMVEDKELNANAILQVILQITNNAEETNIKKVLAVFSITNGELHWTGTVRGENDQVVAFTEEGLDALFEVNEPSEEELEDII